MKRILWLIVATFAICLTTPTSYAQSSLKLRFSVPSAFTSGNTVFPAGECRNGDVSRAKHKHE